MAEIPEPLKVTLTPSLTEPLSIRFCKSVLKEAKLKPFELAKFENVLIAELRAVLVDEFNEEDVMEVTTALCNELMVLYATLPMTEGSVVVYQLSNCSVFLCAVVNPSENEIDGVEECDPRSTLCTELTKPDTFVEY